MAMSRERKEAEVENLHARFANDEVVILTHNLGLTVKQMTELRNALREEGASYKVTKNSLARLAVKGTPHEVVLDLFSGPTGVASSVDPVAAAKVAHNFAKKNDKLVILGGSLNGVTLDEKGVSQLAELPSLDELRAKLVGLVQAPAQKIATIMQAVPTKTARVFAAYGDTGQ